MMLVICGPLRRLVGFQRQVYVDAPTVSDGLSTLCSVYPDLRKVLFDASGQLRGVHRLALNHTLLHRSELATPVVDADEVELMTALAGG